MTANFKSFKAYRYDSGKVEMAQVIAPPYDVIDSERQERLYAQSPYNCIRLILNKGESRDSLSNNRYTRAHDFLKTWCQQSILTEESAASYYLYRQTFTDLVTGETRQRVSLLGRLKVEPFDKGVVVAHEKTMARPKKDRMELIKATEANLSPIFGLFDDPEGEVAPLFQRVLSRSCVFEVEDEDKVRHALWIIQDEELEKNIYAKLQDRKIYIADGHHRYQTALDYALKRHQDEGVPLEKEMPYDFVLTALVPFHDPGLALYPTHRILSSLEAIPSDASGGFGREEAARKLRPYFEIESVSSEELTEKIEKTPDGQIVFGLLFGSQSWLLTLKDWQAAKAKMTPGKADIWYQLDSNILSHLILGALWQLPEPAWETSIFYTHSYEEVVDSLRSGRGQAAFLMKAPKVETLREMGTVGELMPQKSTYFYPKLASGLVFHKMTSA